MEGTLTEATVLSKIFPPFVAFATPLPPPLLLAAPPPSLHSIYSLLFPVVRTTWSMALAKRTAFSVVTPAMLTRPLGSR